MSQYIKNTCVSTLVDAKMKTLLFLILTLSIAKASFLDFDREVIDNPEGDDECVGVLVLFSPDYEEIRWIFQLLKFLSFNVHFLVCMILSEKYNTKSLERKWMGIAVGKSTEGNISEVEVKLCILDFWMKPSLKLSDPSKKLNVDRNL